MGPLTCSKYFSTVGNKIHLISNKLDFLGSEDGVNEGEMLFFLNYFIVTISDMVIE